ncbi:ACP phosphodiesterase [Saccharicrinis sp. FJH54]|uniref:acyl carrier protein phosphodiesterase n=1 Tax=Saccharicrinis sp. FJH54 TaxID=3344665 RepID=UPI0035D438D5
MNFLAHLLLSYPDEDEMTGNFMGDFVKGKSYLNYPVPIRNGILIHRAIDDFTDQNRIARRLVVALRPVYKRYAGVVSDIVFDHILARDFKNWSGTDIDSFARYSYKALADRRDILPERVSFILDRIRESRRLEMYASLEGIKNSVQIMSDRTSLPDHTRELMIFMEKQSAFITKTFEEFYPELILRVKQKRQELQLHKSGKNRE